MYKDECPAVWLVVAHDENGLFLTTVAGENFEDADVAAEKALADRSDNDMKAVLWVERVDIETLDMMTEVIDAYCASRPAGDPPVQAKKMDAPGMY